MILRYIIWGWREVQQWIKLTYFLLLKFTKNIIIFNHRKWDIYFNLLWFKSNAHSKELWTMFYGKIIISPMGCEQST